MIYRRFLIILIGLVFAGPVLAAPVPKHILFVMTSNAELYGTGKKTGVWLENLTIPYYKFKDAGYEVTLASINGLRPPIDPRSEAQPDASAKRFLADKDAMRQFNDTIPVGEVKAENYDAVFLPGGHGAMWDSMNNAVLTALMGHFANDHKLIAAIDHGQVALLGVNGPDGEPVVKGHKMTAFTREEEKAMGLGSIVPGYTDITLEKSDAILLRAPPFTVNAVQDGNFITGQNPASAEKVAALTLKALKKQGTGR